MGSLTVEHHMCERLGSKERADQGACEEHVDVIGWRVN